MTSDHVKSLGLPKGVTAGDRIAGLSLAAQAVAIVLVLGFYLYETLRGETDDPMRAMMSMVTIGLLGLFVAVVARFLLRGAAGARTPAIVWCVLLLPVGYDLVRGGQPGWGLLLLASAIAVIVGCLTGLRAGARSEPGARADGD